MKPLVSMRAALRDPQLFGTIFAGPSWAGWRTLLTAIVGEELTADERIVFEGLTGRQREPLEPVDEAWFIFGRRAGKTRSAAILAAYLSALCDHDDTLAIGERGLLPILSASVWQAQKAFNFLSGIFEQVPALNAMVVAKTSETIALSNNIDLECRPANFRTIRGVTCIGMIADEVAYWRNEESRNPDKEIIDAARPSLATTGGPLIIISSPYAKRGELWNSYKRDFGPAGDPKILVAKAASRTLNPTLPERVVARAYERDPQAASAEYGAEFRNDVSGFLDFETVEAAIDRGVTVRAPRAGIRYESGCDPSGGARDSFTLAIAHNDNGVAILDCVVEIKPPFSPTAATERIAEVLKSYGLTATVGDHYSAEWVVDAMNKVGITYKHSERDRSAIYLDALPMFTSGRARLLDNLRLASQFVGLERRTAPNGRDRVDHGPNGHDDLCNSAALALVMAGTGSEPGWLGFYRERAEAVGAAPEPAPAAKHQYDGGKVALRVPLGCGGVQGWSGNNYYPDAKGLIFVNRDDAPPLRRAGFVDAEIEVSPC